MDGRARSIRSGENFFCDGVSPACASIKVSYILSLLTKGERIDYNKFMRKISVSGYGYLERLGVDRSFVCLGKAGMEAMDFPLYSEADRMRFYLDGKGTLAEKCSVLREKAAANGLVIGQTHAPFGYREGASLDEIADIYCHSIHATKLLGADKVVLHPVKFENCFLGHRQEECFDMNAELFRRLIPTLRETGVTALLENMFLKVTTDGYDRLYPTLYSSGAELLRAKTLLGDCFSICLDVGHALITKEDIPAMVRTLGGNILALHLHDNTGDRDDHSVPYFGKVPFINAMRALKEVAYAGNVNFEVHFKRVPEEHMHTVLSYLVEVGKAFRDILDGE